MCLTWIKVAVSCFTTKCGDVAILVLVIFFSYETMSFSLCLSFSDEGVCEPDKVGVCSYLGLNRFPIFIYPKRATQKQLSSFLSCQAHTIKSFDLPESCRTMLPQFLCHLTFPWCDPSTAMPRPRQLCRHYCKIVRDKLCGAKHWQQINQAAAVCQPQMILPNCEDLPEQNGGHAPECINPPAEFRQRSNALEQGKLIQLREALICMNNASSEIILWWELSRRTCWKTWTLEMTVAATFDRSHWASGKITACTGIREFMLKTTSLVIPMTLQLHHQEMSMLVGMFLTDKGEHQRNPKI